MQIFTINFLKFIQVNSFEIKRNSNVNFVAWKKKMRESVGETAHFP